MMVEQEYDMDATFKLIDKQIAINDVLLYMKGTASRPLCGFSATAISCLQSCGHAFATVNVLQNPDIRAGLPQYGEKWPTFPQLYIKGELIGGCDIIREMTEFGELKSLMNDRLGAATVFDDELFNEASLRA